MKDGTTRTPARWRAVAAVAGIALAAALPAAATPSCTTSACRVFFDGPSGFGLTQADANIVSATLGIPIVSPPLFALASGNLEPSALDFDQTTDLMPFPPSATGPNRAQWSWTIRNVSSVDLIGNPYYLFTSIDPTFVDQDGNTVDYTGTPISMTLDPSLDPWVIVQAIDGSSQSFFYPAVDLGSLPVGADADPFLMQLLIEGPLVQTGPSRYVLPRLNAGMAFTPIPEPGSAILLILGLAGLGAVRRRRP
jgi:hypothetical protein